MVIPILETEENRDAQKFVRFQLMVALKSAGQVSIKCGAAVADYGSVVFV